MFPATDITAQSKVQPGSHWINESRHAILAALSIADECFQAQEELDRVRAELADRAAKLAEKITRVLPGAADDD